MLSPEKQAFFEEMEASHLALTFDDVRMRTRAGIQPLPDDIDVQSKISANVELKVPFVSAAMDTVTTADMAIAMAKFGGLGVIHAAMPINDQYREARRVKKAINGLIESPVTVKDTDTLDKF